MVSKVRFVYCQILNVCFCVHISIFLENICTSYIEYTNSHQTTMVLPVLHIGRLVHKRAWSRQATIFLPVCAWRHQAAKLIIARILTGFLYQNAGDSKSK